MPRRNSAAKRLNISTDSKIESLGDSSAAKATNEGLKQPQHKSMSNKQVPENNPTTMSQRIANSKQHSGETNDSRVAPNVPQHKQLMNPIASKPRDQQISVMLEHRKLLLQRIRQSKAAAEARLKKPSRRSVVKLVEGRSEEDSYKELTRMAVQAAKKQRQDEQQQQQSQEKRVSVSLRRGSSVGKRMSAAISALTPGSSDAVAPAPAAVPAAPTAVSSMAAAPTTTGSATVATKKLKTSNTTQSHSHGGAHPGKVMSHEPKKRANYKNNKSAAQSRPHMVPPYAYASSQPIMSESIPVPKRAVIFPEAIALRDRKKAVQAKLNTLLERRRKEMKPAPKKLPVFAKGASVIPSKLPKRRKTQWDYVLEEMRWLATDFCEERKWKASSGRVMGAAVLTHYSDIKKAAEDKKAAAASKEQIEQQIIEDEKKDADGDAVMEEDVEATRSDPESKVMPPQNQLYPSPTEEDITSLRSNATLISTMVSELWEGVLKSGSNWTKKQPEMVVADTSKDNMLEASPAKEVEEKEQKAEVSKSSEVASPEDVKDKEPKSETSETPAPAQLSHEAIAKKVKSLLDRIDRRPRQRTRAKQSSNKTKYTLTPVEQKASDFVDFLWKGGAPAGAILGDAYSFNPFDVGSLLLKQHLSDGPHLVLCPPSRVLRWFSELKATSGARILLVSSDGEVDGKINDLAKTDIVVAELSAGVTGDHLDISQFESVVLDGYATMGTSKKISSREIRQGIHAELRSDTWWSCLLRSLSTKNQRRLMVANSFMMLESDNASALLHRLDERERLDLIAGMTAFVFGPSLFQSPKRSPSHRVLAWAKNRVKKDQGKGQTKIEQIESHLFDLLKRLTFAPEDHFENVQQSFEEKSIFDTEVVLCKIAPRQQTAYDKCCRNLRGALSLGGSLVDAASGFMQLREVCFHARLRDVCNSPSASPSQPNFERVAEIIEESAKLKELVIVLIRDFGYQVEGIDDLESIFPELQPKSRRNSKPAKEGVPKVAIVASSPYAQRLISILLAALGIDHENLVDSQRFRGSGATATSRSSEGGKGNLGRSVPWMSNQRSLLRYENSDVDHTGFPFPSVEALVTPRASNIILGSTMDFAQQGNGLSVEASDVLIFLDEDWSGRECKAVKRILVRCFLHRARHEVERPDFRVYRFICDNCCEEKLLCGFKDNDNTLELIESSDWCVNAVGLLELEDSFEMKDESFDHFDPDYVFEFPGRNLVSFENEELASFLGTKSPLPTNLESGKELKFLPFEKASAVLGCAHRETILSFTKELIEEEVSLRSEAKLLGMKVFDDRVELPQLVSMQSMLVAPVRHYVERFGISGSNSNVPITDGHSASVHSNSLYFASDGDAPNRDAGEPSDGILSEESKIPAGNLSGSILFYSAAPDKKRKQVDSAHPTGSMATNASTRLNAFSNVYSQASSSWTASARDGMQGSEPLVYFPPVFPSIRQIAAQAEGELSHLRSQSQGKKPRTNDTPPILGPDTTKRQFDGAEDALLAKRPRIESVEIARKNIGQGAPAKSTVQVLPTPNLVPTLKPEHIPPSGISPKVGPPSRPMVLSNGPSTARPQEIVSFENVKILLVDLDEDFGLLGVGALPLHANSSKDAAVESVELTEYFTTSANPSNDDLLSDTLCCDFEEAEGNRKGVTDTDLGAMILFVPRKTMPGSRPMYASPPSLGGHPQLSQWNTSMPAMNPSPFISANGMSGDVKANGAASKKGKRKSATPTSFALTAPSLPGGVPQGVPGLASTMNQVKGKDALRHEILAMYGGRPGYGAPGLFESANFRLAALRVRDRICDRVSKAMGAVGGFPVQKRHAVSNRPWQAQLQAHSPPQWTSVVALLDSATELPKRLPMDATRADFGPFQVGNLPSVNDVTNIPHPKPGVGLGLPVGVKLLSSRHIRQTRPWMPADDSRLHVLAVRYGMNWHLVASNLANYRCPTKSATQCRERWHQLAKADVSLYKEMEKVQQCDTAAAVLKVADSLLLTTANNKYRRESQEDHTSMDLEDSDQLSVPEVLQPRSGSSETCLAPIIMESSPSELTGHPKKRRSFARFRAAALKRKNVPMPIPGVVAGQKPSLAITHASHHQALQAAVAALSPGGRTEMWPLQILDLADKQRKASRAATAAVRAPHVNHRSSGSYQTTQSRHASAQQQYAPPIVQPTTHKVGIPPQPQSSGK